MKLLVISALAFAVLALHESNAVRHYDGYKVYRVPVTSEDQFEMLEMLRDTTNLDFWSGPMRGRRADILVSPEQESLLLSFLDGYKMPRDIMVNDVESLVETQRYQQAQEGRMDWNDYHSLDAIYAWLNELESNYSYVSVSTIGKSTEGRDLKVVKLSTGGNGTRGALWIDATIHAREWISTSTITYIINQLTANASSYENILQTIDLYFLPVVNPDGYEYSRTVDRLWRKTRSVRNGTSCVGVDANRNFGFQWSSGGSSPDPCSITFAGPDAFSEPEARAVRDYILNRNIAWQGFVTLHSYSQLWMTPWGYTKDFPDNYDEMMRVANKSVAALGSVHGTSYEAGSAANILYESSGTSRDWAKGEPNIRFVYTIELRDTGRYGFVLPSDQILPTGEETWAGIYELAKEIAGIAN